MSVTSIEIATVATVPPLSLVLLKGSADLQVPNSAIPTPSNWFLCLTLLVDLNRSAAGAIFQFNCGEISKGTISCATLPTEAKPSSGSDASKVSESAEIIYSPGRGMAPIPVRCIRRNRI